MLSIFKVSATVQVTVRVAVLLLPHASVAVNVRVCELVEPAFVTALSAAVTTAVLHESVAVALPKAASIAATSGLFPSIRVVPVAVTTGPVESTVQTTVREAVLLLPHASVAVNVRVCELVQPVMVTVLSAAVTVAVLHVSVAVALPSAASIAGALGLQPNANVVPVAVTIGGVGSAVQVTVREAGLVLP